MTEGTEQTPQDVEAEIGALILGEDPVESPEKQVEPPEPQVDEPTEEVAEDQPEDSEDEPQEDDADDEASEYVEIEHEGQLYQVPPTLKEAFLRQSDYTVKTQEVAQNRKQVELQAQEVQTRNDKFTFAEQVRDDLMQVENIGQQIEQAKQYMRDNIEGLTHTDIEKIRLAIDDHTQKRDKIINEVRQKHDTFQQAQEQTREELLKKGTEILAQRIPGWGEAQQSAAREYALKSGFSEQEINLVVDPRQVETLWKASQYDALKAGAAPAVRAVQNAPTIKPKGRDPMPKDVRQKLDLRKKLHSKSLSDKQKADALAQDIGERWG